MRYALRMNREIGMHDCETRNALDLAALVESRDPREAAALRAAALAQLPRSPQFPRPDPQRLTSPPGPRHSRRTDGYRAD